MVTELIASGIYGYFINGELVSSSCDYDVHQYCIEHPHLLKGVLSLKIKKINIHLYFIATYVWNNALVKYKDNWTRQK